jgi:hypothetical protein
LLEDITISEVDELLEKMSEASSQSEAVDLEEWPSAIALSDNPDIQYLLS